MRAFEAASGRRLIFVGVSFCYLTPSNPLHLIYLFPLPLAESRDLLLIHFIRLPWYVWFLIFNSFSRPMNLFLFQVKCMLCTRFLRKTNKHVICFTWPLSHHSLRLLARNSTNPVKTFEGQQRKYPNQADLTLYGRSVSWHFPSNLDTPPIPSAPSSYTRHIADHQPDNH